MIEMGKCRNLDLFYDVVFRLDDGKMLQANSLILQQRSDYFRGMLNTGFFESLTDDIIGPKLPIRIVRVHGISNTYFAAILQYLYTDHYC